MERKERIERLLEDAREMWEESMKLKDVSLRQASEKAWCSAYNATRALFLKETGNPEIPRDRDKGRGTQVRELVTNLGKPELYDQFATFQSSLHGACFYGGYCFFQAFF